VVSDVKEIRDADANISRKVGGGILLDPVKAALHPVELILGMVCRALPFVKHVVYWEEAYFFVLDSNRKCHSGGWLSVCSVVPRLYCKGYFLDNVWPLDEIGRRFLRQYSQAKERGRDERTGATTWYQIREFPRVVNDDSFDQQERSRECLENRHEYSLE
jgi:hypothetical protein